MRRLVKRSIYVVLAALFIYKALEEAGSDPVWGLIYLLVGVEYILEGGGPGKHGQGQ